MLIYITSTTSTTSTTSITCQEAASGHTMSNMHLGWGTCFQTKGIQHGPRGLLSTFEAYPPNPATLTGSTPHGLAVELRRGVKVIDLLCLVFACQRRGLRRAEGGNVPKELSVLILGRTELTQCTRSHHRRVFANGRVRHLLTTLHEEAAENQEARSGEESLPHEGRSWG